MPSFDLTAQLNIRAPTNAQARAVKSQIERSLGKIDIPLNIGGRDVEVRLKKITDQTKKATRETQHFGEAIALAGKRFIAYSVATAGVIRLSNAISKATSDAIRLGKEVGKLKQTFAEGTFGGIEGILKISKSYGLANTKVAETVRILGQAGFAFKDAVKGADLLAKTTLLASFDNLSDTTEGLIALMATFKLSVGDAGKQLDIINTVSKRYAIESNDLVSAIKRAGGQFASTGGKAEELIALITKVRSTTRESADAIATGFRTIFSRLQRPKTIEFFKKLNIELATADGNFVGNFEAIQRITKGLDKLGIKAGSIDFAKVVEEIGGIRQVSRVIPLITDANKTLEIYNVTQEASGETAKDVAIAQATLANQLDRLRQNFANLFAEVGQSSELKLIAEAFIGIANAAIETTRAFKPLIPLLGLIAGYKLTGLVVQGAKTKGLLNFAGIGDKYATGGFVPGKGNKDTEPALLTPGEFVINKKSAQKIGYSNLEEINRYAKGGPVGNIQHLADGGRKDKETRRNNLKIHEQISELEFQAAIDPSRKVEIQRQIQELKKGIQNAPAPTADPSETIKAQAKLRADIDRNRARSGKAPLGQTYNTRTFSVRQRVKPSEVVTPPAQQAVVAASAQKARSAKPSKYQYGLGNIPTSLGAAGDEASARTAAFERAEAIKAGREAKARYKAEQSARRLEARKAGAPGIYPEGTSSTLPPPPKPQYNTSTRRVRVRPAPSYGLAPSVEDISQRTGNKALQEGLGAGFGSKNLSAQIQEQIANSSGQGLNLLKSPKIAKTVAPATLADNLKTLSESGKRLTGAFTDLGGEIIKLEFINQVGQGLIDSYLGAESATGKFAKSLLESSTRISQFSAVVKTVNSNLEDLKTFGKTLKTLGGDISKTQLGGELISGAGKVKDFLFKRRNIGVGGGLKSAGQSILGAAKNPLSLGKSLFSPAAIGGISTAASASITKSLGSKAVGLAAGKALGIAVAGLTSPIGIAVTAMTLLSLAADDSAKSQKDAAIASKNLAEAQKQAGRESFAGATLGISGVPRQAFEGLANIIDKMAGEGNVLSNVFNNIATGIGSFEDVLATSIPIISDYVKTNQQAAEEAIVFGKTFQASADLFAKGKSVLTASKEDRGKFFAAQSNEQSFINRKRSDTSYSLGNLGRDFLSTGTFGTVSSSGAIKNADIERATAASKLNSVAYTTGSFRGDKGVVSGDAFTEARKKSLLSQSGSTEESVNKQLEAEAKIREKYAQDVANQQTKIIQSGGDFKDYLDSLPPELALLEQATGESRQKFDALNANIASVSLSLRSAFVAFVEQERIVKSLNTTNKRYEKSAQNISGILSLAKGESQVNVDTETKSGLRFAGELGGVPGRSAVANVEGAKALKESFLPITEKIAAQAKAGKITSSGEDLARDLRNSIDQANIGEDLKKALNTKLEAIELDGALTTETIEKALDDLSKAVDDGTEKSKTALDALAKSFSDTANLFNQAYSASQGASRAASQGGFELGGRIRGRDLETAQLGSNFGISNIKTAGALIPQSGLTPEQRVGTYNETLARKTGIQNSLASLNAGGGTNAGNVRAAAELSTQLNKVNEDLRNQDQAIQQDISVRTELISNLKEQLDLEKQRTSAIRSSIDSLLGADREEQKRIKKTVQLAEKLNKGTEYKDLSRREKELFSGATQLLSPEQKDAKERNARISAVNALGLGGGPIANEFRNVAAKGQTSGEAAVQGRIGSQFGAINTLESTGLSALNQEAAFLSEQFKKIASSLGGGENGGIFTIDSTKFDDSVAILDSVFKNPLKVEFPTQFVVSIDSNEALLGDMADQVKQEVARQIAGLKNGIVA